MPLSRKYNSTWSSDYPHKRNIESYYKVHEQLSNYIYLNKPLHTALFHNCEFCIDEWEEDVEKYNFIRVWFERIRKYEARFPEYKMIYVNRPVAIAK
jgi:hypothetical protein